MLVENLRSQMDEFLMTIADLPQKTSNFEQNLKPCKDIVRLKPTQDQSDIGPDLP